MSLLRNRIGNMTVNNALEATAALSGTPFAYAKVASGSACYHTPQCLAPQRGVSCPKGAIMKNNFYFLSLVLVSSFFLAQAAEKFPKKAVHPVRMTWRTIPAENTLDVHEGLLQLPKSIDWVPYPYHWQILPTSYTKDGAAVGPYKVIRRDDLGEYPYNLNLENLSSTSVEISLVKNSETPIFRKTYDMKGKPVSEFTLSNDGSAILEYSGVTCGDRERFEVSAIILNGAPKILTDCTASASFSPDHHKVFLDDGIVDLDLWILRSFPAGFPEFGEVLAWSKDGTQVALSDLHRIIIVQLK